MNFPTKRSKKIVPIGKQRVIAREGKQPRAGQATLRETNGIHQGRSEVVQVNDGNLGTTMERARANSQARRLELISRYEQEYDCNLSIIRDNLLNDSIALFDDVTEHCRPDRALHLMVETPGGDGETALRIARACLQRSRRFTLIVADWCKSAGTYLALAADEVVLGPMGDLGPVDPQLIFDGSPRGAAAELVNALDAAEKAICAHESLSPLYESLTSHIGLG